ncbi:ran-specific GTPase-activating protein-like [Leptopilina heterotoma]|uniref:ran-specific GTPase-activating protein-like n=1 Tax=Leptopilina heterotoma TaxID=63436 RepID=UPI001CA8871A|nr:ran-specific GTPase-activating protein-like [Leptopilina heterotoma]
MPENVLNADNATEVNGGSGEPHETDEEPGEDDLHFEPIVSLPLIEVSNNEEDEVEMIKLRAKLYRYDSSNNPAEWKERGTGEVKLLRHQTKNTVRVVMRRDKTLKICANHFITPWMELKPNCGSDRAWVWSVLADFADEQIKPELLAIRFANAENATLWKETFEKAKKIVGSECEIYSGKSNPDDYKSDDDDSDSDSCSEVSYEESDNDEGKEKLTITEINDTSKEVTKEETKSKEDDVKKTEEVTTELDKLTVKSE